MGISVYVEKNNSILLGNICFSEILDGLFHQIRKQKAIYNIGNVVYGFCHAYNIEEKLIQRFF